MESLPSFGKPQASLCGIPEKTRRGVSGFWFLVQPSKPANDLIKEINENPKLAETGIGQADAGEFLPRSI
jgi:hypothetical protein